MGADWGEVVTNYLAASQAATDGADKQVLAEIRETYQDATAPAIPRTAERIRGPRTMARSDKSILALGGAGRTDRPDRSLLTPMPVQADAAWVSRLSAGDAGVEVPGVER